MKNKERKRQKGNDQKIYLLNKTKNFIIYFLGIGEIRSTYAKFKEFQENHKKLSPGDRVELEERIYSSIINKFNLSVIFIFVAIFYFGIFYLLANIEKALNYLANQWSTFLSWQSTIDLDSITFFGKSSWDWAELLIVPVMLASFGIIFQRFLEKRNNERDQHDILSFYISEMSNFVLTSASHKPDNGKISAICKSLTTSTLQQLNDSRQKQLKKFIIESGSYKFLDVDEMNFSDIVLENAVIEEGEFEEVRLCRCKLLNICFKDTKLKNAKMWTSKLYKSFFLDSQLNEIYMPGCRINKSDFSGSTLTDANLEGCAIFNTKFINTNFTGASFWQSHFYNTDFNKANLTNVYLFDSDLSDVNLTDTNLQDIQWNKRTKWPSPEQVAKAKNIPEELKQQLGIQ